MTSAIRSLSSKLEKEKKSNDKHYDAVKTAQSIVKSQPIEGSGPSDHSDFLHDMFLTLKEEIRWFLEYRSLVQRNSEKLSHIHTYEDFTRDIADFDNEFKIQFGELYQNEKIDILKRLLIIKDKYFFSLCRSGLEGIDIDLIQPYRSETLKGRSSWSDFFTLLQSINSLKIIVEKSNMSKTENELSVELASKQLELNELHDEYEFKVKEIADLKNRVQAIMIESGRQQLFARQHDRIGELETEVNKISRENKDLWERNRKLLMENSSQRDELNGLRSQVSNLKETCQSNLQRIQPFLEQNIQKSFTERREFQMLQNEIEMNSLKINTLEKTIKDLQHQLEDKNRIVATLETEKKIQFKLMLGIQAEAKKQSHLKLVAVAAKIGVYDQLKEKESLLNDCQNKLNESLSQKKNLEDEIVEMEKYIDQLQSIIEQAEKNTSESEERYKTLKAEVLSLELSNKSLLELTEKWKSQGCSDEKLQEFDELQRKINDYEEKMKALKKRNKEAMDQIFELQGKLLGVMNE